MNEIELEQGSENWLRWRRGDKYVTADGLLMAGTADGGPRITATAASVIAGSNPFQTPEELWGELMGLRKPKDLNYVMARGKDMEPAAREAYCALVGEDYQSVCLQSGEHDWIGSSPDGLDIMRTRGVEIKCPISESEDGSHKQAMRGVVVQYYYDQIQWQHLSADNQLTEIDYFSFAPSIGYAAPIPVKVDLERQKFIIERVIAFRVSIMERVPLCGTEFEKAAKSYLLLKRKLDDLTFQVEAAKANLKTLAGGKGISGGGVSVGFTKSKPAAQWGKVINQLQDQFLIKSEVIAEMKEQHSKTIFEPNLEAVVQAIAQAYAVEASMLADMVEASKDAPKITVTLRETAEAGAILEQLKVQTIEPPKNTMKTSNQGADNHAVV